MMNAMVANPYFGKNFFEFIWIFFQRMFELLMGKIGITDLVSDEIQVLVLCFVGCASALVGTFLVLKKMTMLANSLSHTVLLGIVVAYVIMLPFIPKEETHAHALSLQTLLIAALTTGLITTLLTQMLTHLLHLQEDASTGLVFTTLFALGIVLVTVFTRNAHLGTEAIMGNVDALHVDDMKLIFWIALFDLAVVAIFFKEFKMTTFDASLANAQGFSSTIFNYLLMVLTSATVIGAFRAVGVLLVLAFLVGPVLSARLMTDRLMKMIFAAIGISIFGSLISVALSRHFLSVYHAPLSTAGLATTVLGVIYCVCLSGKGFLKFRQMKVREHIHKT
jgi:manganese/zinc/iron transport system permease protein